MTVDQLYSKLKIAIDEGYGGQNIVLVLNEKGLWYANDFYHSDFEAYIG